jgi:hypothetical protein
VSSQRERPPFTNCLQSPRGTNRLTPPQRRAGELAGDRFPRCAVERWACVVRRALGCDEPRAASGPAARQRRAAPRAIDHAKPRAGRIDDEAVHGARAVGFAGKALYVDAVAAVADPPARDRGLVRRRRIGLLTRTGSCVDHVRDRAPPTVARLIASVSFQVSPRRDGRSAAGVATGRHDGSGGGHYGSTARTAIGHDPPGPGRPGKGFRGDGMRGKAWIAVRGGAAR